MRIYKVEEIQMELEGVKSMRELISCKFPTLAKLKKQYGKRGMLAYIKLWLVSLNSSLNVSKNLTESQISDLARLILSNFWALTIGDISVIFDKAKMGGFGELYGSLSMDKINRWFMEHYEERLNVAGRMAMEENDRYKYNDEKVGRISEIGRKEGEESVKDIKLKQLLKDYKKAKGERDE